MNIKKEISIIIPCYNVENYIIDCLNSIKKQLSNFKYEIILINDCSSDNTEKLINKYIKDNKEKNIKLLSNKNNMGAGYSRNRAVEVAKYDYISFVDADDYLDDNYYDELFSHIIKKNLDVVVCDINVVYEDNTPSVIGYGCEGTINNINMINTGFAASPCNKIIKKELLLKYPFAEGIMNEDIACIISILANCGNIYYTSNTKYNYVQHSSSMQNKKFTMQRFNLFKSIEILKERIINNKDYKKIMDIVTYQQIYLFYIYVIPRENNLFKRTKYLKVFRKLAKDYNFYNNEYIKESLVRRGSKDRFFYKLIFNLNNKGFSFITSLIIGLFNIYHNIKYSNFVQRNFSVIKNDINIDDLIKLAKKQQRMDNKLKISVVIPNYNYEKFLYQRLYSILNQNYKLYEIIILDDCSKDNSRKLIDDIVRKLSPYINISKNYNKVNSGTAFKQWKKGFDLVKGDYVWIAEADDYCDKNMISLLAKKIENDKDIRIAYVDTAYINTNGFKILNSIKNEIDIQKSGHWDNDFISIGKDEILNYAYLNCTIANVSSCLIKNDDYTEILKKCSTYKQVGDWYFYVSVMNLGKICFVNKPINYYRVHGFNVTSLNKKQLHLNEIKELHSLYKKLFNLNSKHDIMMKERIQFLEKVWDLKK